MRNLTLSLDERLLAESREYARKQGTTLNQLVRDFLIKAVGQEPGAAFSSMIDEAKQLDLRSADGPLTREEIYQRG